MDHDVQPPEPAQQLLEVATEVAPDWLRRITVGAAAAAGFDPESISPALESMVELESERLLRALGQLLATDVDDQRTNPLSLFRAAVAAPTAWLSAAGVPATRSDRFTGDLFPDDTYGLGPATWSDIDPRLHEPGLIWGAWKAMTILRRRSDEGLR